MADPTRKADTVGSSLDHLNGKWADEEAVEMEQALEEFEIVDETAWR